MPARRPVTPRRIETVDRPGFPPDFPAALAVCVIEEWCAENDPELVESCRSHGGTPHEPAMCQAATARQRFGRARREWCAERGIDWRTLPRAGYPRWKR
jgi:hypothetical protein